MIVDLTPMIESGLLHVVGRDPACECEPCVAARRIAADQINLVLAREVEEARRELLQPARIRRGQG